MVLISCHISGRISHISAVQALAFLIGKHSWNLCRFWWNVLKCDEMWLCLCRGRLTWVEMFWNVVAMLWNVGYDYSLLRDMPNLICCQMLCIVGFSWSWNLYDSSGISFMSHFRADQSHFSGASSGFPYWEEYVKSLLILMKCYEMWWNVMKCHSGCMYQVSHGWNCAEIQVKCFWYLEKALQ